MVLELNLDQSDYVLTHCCGRHRLGCLTVRVCAVDLPRLLLSGNEKELVKLM